MPKTRGKDGIVYTVMSDGEVQEGSTWEATLMASSLGVSNLVAFIDNNNMQARLLQPIRTQASIL